MKNVEYSVSALTKRKIISNKVLRSILTLRIVHILRKRIL